MDQWNGGAECTRPHGGRLLRGLATACSTARVWQEGETCYRGTVQGDGDATAHPSNIGRPFIRSHVLQSRPPDDKYYGTSNRPSAEVYVLESQDGTLNQ